MNKDRKVHVWRLRKVMADRDIWTATELHRRLTDYGIELSSAQVSRIIQERPQRINTDLLDALVNILDCEICDLLKAEVASDATRGPEPDKKPKKGAKPEKTEKTAMAKVTNLNPGAAGKGGVKGKIDEETLRRLVGPKVTALPMSEEK